MSGIHLSSEKGFGENVDSWNVLSLFGEIQVDPMWLTARTSLFFLNGCSFYIETFIVP